MMPLALEPIDQTLPLLHSKVLVQADVVDAVAVAVAGAAGVAAGVVAEHAPLQPYHGPVSEASSPIATIHPNLLLPPLKGWQKALHGHSYENSLFHWLEESRDPESYGSMPAQSHSHSIPTRILCFPERPRKPMPSSLHHVPN